MKCIHCRAWAFVLKTRTKADGTRFRRYECANGHRFNTSEQPVEGAAI